MYNFFILTIISSSLLISNNFKSYDNYYDFIINNNGFIQSNYIEDDNNYYYLYTYDISKLRNSRRWNRNKQSVLDNAFKKARLTAISNLMESICCGFDISNFRNISKLNLIDNNNNKMSYKLDINQSSDTKHIETFLEDVIEDDIFYGVKINKNKALNASCSCNLKLN